MPDLVADLNPLALGLWSSDRYMWGISHIRAADCRLNPIQNLARLLLKRYSIRSLINSGQDQTQEKKMQDVNSNVSTENNIELLFSELDMEFGVEGEARRC